MIIQYKELKVGDIILWYGAKERVKEIRITELREESKKIYPNEKRIHFTLEPVDEEALKILGKFYAHGEYGGVGCLKVEKIN